MTITEENAEYVVRSVLRSRSDSPALILAMMTDAARTFPESLNLILDKLIKEDEFKANSDRQKAVIQALLHLDLAPSLSQDVEHYLCDRLLDLQKGPSFENYHLACVILQLLLVSAVPYNIDIVLTCALTRDMHVMNDLDLALIRAAIIYAKCKGRLESPEIKQAMTSKLEWLVSKDRRAMIKSADKADAMVRLSRHVMMIYKETGLPHPKQIIWTRLQSQPSQQVNMEESFSLVHMTDLHLSYANAASSYEKVLHEADEIIGDENIYKKVVEHIANECDHIVVTGDITQSGRRPGLSVFYETLKAKGFLCADKLTIIPGNHDIAFPKNILNFKQHKCALKHVRFLLQDVDTWAKSDKDPIQIFKSSGNCVVYPPDDNHNNLFPSIKIFKKANVAILSIDSTSCFPAEVIGLNARGQFSNSMKQIKNLVQDPAVHNALEECKVKIVASHHPFWPFPKLLKGSDASYGPAWPLSRHVKEWCMQAWRAREVFEFLIANGFVLFLAGHIHREIDCVCDVSAEQRIGLHILDRCAPQEKEKRDHVSLNKICVGKNGTEVTKVVVDLKN